MKTSIYLFPATAQAIPSPDEGSKYLAFTPRADSLFNVASMAIGRLSFRNNQPRPDISFGEFHEDCLLGDQSDALIMTARVEGFDEQAEEHFILDQVSALISDYCPDCPLSPACLLYQEGLRINAGRA